MPRVKFNRQGNSSTDGSKFRACNSRHKSYTNKKVAKMLEYYEECANKYIELMEMEEPPENICKLKSKT